MPTTSDGTFVYADPAAVEDYVQTDAGQFSKSTSGSPSEWRQFLETVQVAAKARIDEFTDRDFEDHPNDTVTLDGGTTGSRVLYLPTPVRSVTEVRVDGDVVDASTYAVRDGQLIRLDEAGERGEWPTGFGNIAVDLDWGYQSPPADVADAEKQLVANTMAKLAQMREGQTVQVDDTTLQVALPSAMTPEVRGMLREHHESGRVGAII